MSEHSCETCGASWSDGAFTKDCEECGGGALSRTCLICDRLCGNVWTKDVSVSHANHKAHWEGRCLLAKDKQDTKVYGIERWQDDSALPDVVTADLHLYDDGSAQVNDSDGGVRSFDTHDQAKRWLEREDYAPIGKPSW